MTLTRKEQSEEGVGTHDDPDNADELRAAIVELCGAHSNAIVQHGTWMLVAGELLNSIVSHLPAQTRADIASTFRGRIERLLALGDDDGFSSTYTTELVKEVNRYLKVLEPSAPS
ncbi:hypothetical protein C0Z18_06110 [Trinickia dabaoshanensis]|uniref:Uncharacterized protein n=1 Tax=Trinickia dabaoshanensis TaxID=564714 RepID=A0A2N7VY45_9BURK|nr:hypothetical protein [Trinickia dabaoshanensis]PMS22089.1 hypothetical protein C0Z18_06110 [Trinickia dabaoshanensis]